MKPRVIVTESDELARALDAAALRWPGESRARLLVLLALAGGQVVEREQELRVTGRLHALEASRGRLAGSYGEDYLTDLRTEWPR